MPMTTPHTKTPWTIYEGENGPIAIVSGETQPGDRMVIARVDHPATSYSYDTITANAAYIVQAVNSHDALVEALKDLVAEAEPDLDGNLNLAEARAALALATGKTS